MVKNSVCDLTALEKRGWETGHAQRHICTPYAFLCLIWFPHWVPCLPVLRHLGYLMLATGLVTIQLSLLDLSGPPGTLFTLSHAFPAEWLRSAVASIWALARGGPLGYVLTSYSPWQSPCQALYLDPSDFCVFLRPLGKSRNPSNLQRKTGWPERAAGSAPSA